MDLNGLRIVDYSDYQTNDYKTNDYQTISGDAG